MGWVRYVLAIAVGLAVGMAVGWYSGRVDARQPQAARSHHHHHHHHHHRGSQSVNVHSQRHTPGHTRPAPQTPPAHVPTMRELQHQMLQCVLGHPYAAGQVACLRAALRALGATPDVWGGQSLPFALPGQD